MSAREGRGGAGHTATGENKQHSHYASSGARHTPLAPTPYFLTRGQRLKWKSEWAVATCTVCGTVNALLVRTSGAFRCTRCDVRGPSLKRLEALEARARKVNA